MGGKLLTAVVGGLTNYLLLGRGGGKLLTAVVVGGGKLLTAMVGGVANYLLPW